MAYASPADVADRLGRPLSEAEQTQAPVLLEDAELLIRNRIRDLDERVAAGEILEAAVVMVEANAVARVLRNPEGFRQEQSGDYMYTLDAQVASGRLFIDDAEWRLLGVAPTAFTIVPKIGTPTGPCPDPWRGL